MRIACIGSGPAGLYFSVLAKLADPTREVTVFERESRGSVAGWGVTFWDDLTKEMSAHDPVSALQIEAAAAHWVGIEVDVEGRGLNHQAYAGGNSIERATLMAILTRRAEELGVVLTYDTPVVADDLAHAYDLVVSADGVNSAFRTRHAAELGTSIRRGRNKFVWLATPKLFPAFRFAFTELGDSWITAYAYQFSADASTFVVEVGEDTWTREGFDRLDADATLRRLEDLFAWQLDGQPLTVKPRSDGSVPWTSFPTLRNRRWHRGNVAIMGDAAHTTHYSIGFGTKLALQDAMALSAALSASPDLESALVAYERGRRRDLRPAQRDAENSQRFYERLERYLPYELDDFTAMLSRRRTLLMGWVPPAAFVGLRRRVLRPARSSA